MPKEDLNDQARERTAAIIKRRLKARARRSEAEVVVRDIIILSGDVSGEFTGVSCHEKDQAKLRDEPESALVERMGKQIKLMATEAESLHLQDNFESRDPAKMHSYMKNHVTRLSFNEFYFYPYKKHGPLSQGGFHALVEIIDTMARAFPENLHLILASFPVVDEHHQLHNMVVHVQCGVDTKLYIFAKSVPSEQDFEYKETLVPYFVSRGQVSSLITQAKKLKSKIVNQILTDNPALDKVKLNRLKKVIQLCGARKQSKAVEAIDQLLALPDDLRITPSEWTEKASYFESVLTNKIKDLKETADKKQKSTVKRIKKSQMKSMVVSHVGSQSFGVNYGGYISCVTAGGAEFTTVIDICLDHAHGMARKMHKHQMMQNAASTPSLIPSIISQVVTSNTIKLDDANVIGESVVHADPLNYKVKRGSVASGSPRGKAFFFGSEKKVVNVEFGSDSKMLTYPVRVLGRVGGELGDTIGQLNRLNKKLQAKLILSRHYPIQADILQHANDIRLRIAFILEDFDQITRLMQEGASVAYVDKDDVSTLSLITKSKKLKAFIESGNKLLLYFNRILLTGQHHDIIKVFDEIVNWDLARDLYPVFATGLDPLLMYEFLRVAIKRGDRSLMSYLINLGVDPLMVDVETGASLFNEALSCDDSVHAGLKVMTHHFSIRNKVTEEILIKALHDIKPGEKAKALSVYLLVAVERNSVVMLAKLVALGANYLGQSPIANHAILKPIFGANNVAINNLIFDDALRNNKLNDLVDVVLKNGVEFDNMLPYLAHALRLNADYEPAMLSLIDYLTKINQYDFILAMSENTSFYEALTKPCQNLLSGVIRDSDAFKVQIQSNDVEAVALSLAKGVNPNLALESGLTPMDYAIVTKNLSLLQCLLDAGANFHSEDDPSFSSFLFAIQSSNWPAVDLIYQCAKSKPHYRLLMDSEMISKVKSKIYEDVSDVISDNIPDDKAWGNIAMAVDVAKNMGIVINLNQSFHAKTLMSEAVSLGNLTAARFLLDHGVELNSINERGLPLISMAISSKKRAIFDFFIERGASTMALDSERNTPLYFAIFKNEPEMVKRLLDINHSKIELNKTDYTLNTYPFFYAVEKNYLKVMKVLLDYGANINIIDKNLEMTALMVAILNDDSVEVIKFLLSHGADPNLAVKSRTPLLYLIKHCNNAEMLEALLLSDKLDINLPQPKTGKTALHIAIDYQKLEMLALLLKHGAAPDLADANGLTPLEHARRLERYGIVRELLKYLEPEAASTEAPHSSSTAKIAKKMKSPVNALKSLMISSEGKHHTGHDDKNAGNHVHYKPSTKNLKPSKHDVANPKKKKR